MNALAYVIFAFIFHQTLLCSQIITIFIQNVWGL